MPQQSTQTDENEGFAGGRYATTERELYEKALALLVNVHEAGAGNPPVLACADLKRAG